MENKYEVIEKVGSGRFSEVQKARDRVTGEIIAVKTIPYKKVTSGVPTSIIREVSLLKELEHENIVRLLDVLPTEKDICLVFEYLDNNLLSFRRTHRPIASDPKVIKKFLHQILHGVAYCHSHKIIHRDLKPENILVDSHNLAVKLADFGLSREVGVPRQTYTLKVATLQYMAPEILFCRGKYSSAMDIWSVGCIFGEMVKGRMWLRGYTERDQLETIFSVLGTPDEETLPGVTMYFPGIVNQEIYPPQDLANEFPNLEPSGVDLLSKMLSLDPSKRITAPDALQHTYFSDFH